MFELLFADFYVNMWGALGTIFGGIASIMAIWAVIYSTTSFKKALTNSHYGELDKTYFDLLKIALEKPHVYRPATIERTEHEQEYELYAFMIWNFLEAIYDRAQKDRHLCATWYPIIDDEGRRHAKWLSKPENQVKFKDEFITFINRRFA